MAKVLALLVVVAGLAGAVFFVSAQTAPTPLVCGDGVVQRPNDSGQDEWCDQRSYCSNNPSISCAPGNNGDECGGGRCVKPCISHDALTGSATDCGTRLLGWGWASTFGWLDLNPPDNCAFLGPDVPAGRCSGDPQETCDPADGGSCGGGLGSCVATCGPYSLPADYFVSIGTDNQVRGWAWSENIGWVCFGSFCQQTADVLPEGAPDNVVVGWAQAVEYGNEGWFSLSCRNEDGGGSTCQPDNVSGYSVRVKRRDFIPTGQAGPGTSRYSFSGFAWNDRTVPGGLGWVQFDPMLNAAQPYLQTRYGDIYSRGGLTGPSQPTQFGGYNSTYRILSGGSIENFRSEQQGTTWISEFYGPIDFPTPDTRYSNVLGKLDISGIVCDHVGSATECQNRYGQTVVKISPASAPSLNSVTSAGGLNGRVYYSPTSYTVSTSLVLRNGQNFINGAGTIVVNGDLIVEQNITYDPSDNLTRIRNLASVAWIIRGDLKIAPGVTKLDGNFIVLGSGSNCSSDPAGEVSGCGQAYSCYQGERLTGASCPNQLTTAGLLMARKFFFDRSYVSLKIPPEGAEVIVYDGRLLANIPPGMENFAQALPIWRLGTFAQ